MTKRTVLAALGLALLGTQAKADVKVHFIESAPKDRFEIHNTSNCALKDVIVGIDLQNSAGQLYFDTTDAGAGVEVFQPFEPRSGTVSLMSSDTVQDGDTALKVRIGTLAAGDRASFTIDVDDAMTNSALGQIRVADSEMSGADVSLEIADAHTIVAQFDGDKALLSLSKHCSTG